MLEYYIYKIKSPQFETKLIKLKTENKYDILQIIYTSSKIKEIIIFINKIK